MPVMISLSTNFTSMHALQDYYQDATGTWVLDLDTPSQCIVDNIHLKLAKLPIIHHNEKAHVRPHPGPRPLVPLAWRENRPSCTYHSNHLYDNLANVLHASAHPLVALLTPFDEFCNHFALRVGCFGGPPVATTSSGTSESAMCL